MPAGCHSLAVASQRSMLIEALGWPYRPSTEMVSDRPLPWRGEVTMPSIASGVGVPDSVANVLSRQAR